MELFKNQLVNEKFMLDSVNGYFIEQELYLTHKEYLDDSLNNSGIGNS